MPRPPHAVPAPPAPRASAAVAAEAPTRAGESAGPSAAGSDALLRMASRLPHPVQLRRARADAADPLEREADDAADGRAGALTPAGQGAGVDASRLPPGVRAAVAGLEGRGRPLSPDARARHEARTGRDLGDVRVHDDPASAALALALSARAFAYGRNVVAADRGVETAEGGRLLGHELAHVGQQGAAPPLGGRRAYAAPRLQRLGWDEVKESAYRAMIDGVRGFKSGLFAAARAYGHAHYPNDAAAVDGVVGAAEVAFDLAMSAIYAVLGIVVGAGEAAAAIVAGLVRLLMAVARYLAALLHAMLGNQAPMREVAADLQAVLSGFGPALYAMVVAWGDRFSAASPERQSLMIGELTGEVLVLIATFGTSAARVGRIPPMSMPVPAMAVTPSGARVLAVATVPVRVAEPAAAILGGATVVAMSSTDPPGGSDPPGSGGGGSGGNRPPAEPAQPPRELTVEQEVERLVGETGVTPEELASVSPRSRVGPTLGEAHGVGGLSAEELSYLARGDRFFSWNPRTRQLGYRGTSRADPATGETIIRVGRDGSWQVTGGASLPPGHAATLEARLRAMLRALARGRP